MDDYNEKLRSMTEYEKDKLLALLYDRVADDFDYALADMEKTDLLQDITMEELKNNGTIEKEKDLVYFYRETPYGIIRYRKN